MLDFSEITLNDKAYFDRYLNLYNPEISELTFTNLYMWRGLYKFRYTEAGGLLCIISVPEKGDPFAFMPIGRVEKDAFDEAFNRLKKYFAANNWQLVFKRVPEKELNNFTHCTEPAAEFVLDVDNSDYIYLTADLVELKGKKFDGKRNHINRFKRQYQYEYVVMDESHIDEALRITHEWCAERDCNLHKGLYCEKLANMELLQNFGFLKCSGALIKINGRFEAYTAGEMLNTNTAVIHIEKAGSKIDGLYTFINQQFCQNRWNNTDYINREQDLGIEGLRKAKRSYNPFKMSNKYTVIFK
jgi:hypothetical protein